MVTFLFLLDIAAAAGTMFLLWRRDKLRASAVFHVVALAVAAAIYGTMVVLAARTELGESGIPFRFGARAFVGMVVWVPFIIFLVATWVRALGAAAADGVTATERRLEDASRELEFGNEARAAKILHGVLQEEPDDPDAHALMAEVQLRRGEYELALGSLRLVMASARDDARFARAVFKAAVILNEHLGDPKAAARELDLLRKRMPGAPEAAKAQDWIVRLMDDAAKEEASR